MDIRDLVRVLLKRWWVFVVAVALTAGGALAYAWIQAPIYTSTVEIIIEPARPDWGLAQSAKMLLRTYMTVADSDANAQKVIDRLELPMRPEELRGNAFWAAEDDRMVIKLEIENRDGNVANDISRTWAELLIEWRDQQNQRQRKEDRVYASLRDEPDYAQTWPKKKILAIAGAIFGLVVAAVVVFFLEWVEANVVQAPEDLEAELGLTVLGAIPRD